MKDTDSDVGAIRLEPEAVEISDKDQSPRRPKKHMDKSLVGAHSIPMRATSDESLEDALIAPRNRKGKNKVILDSDSDDPRPRKRKLIKGLRPPSPEEDGDIVEAEHRE